MVFKGRYTAQVDEPIVVFLIGARINKLLRFRRWWWVAMAMPRMMRKLSEVPELGLLHAESFSRGRTTLMVQYWRSFADLERFARDKELPHLEPWRRLNKQMRESDEIGFWHETYTIQPGQVEAIYGNMPMFGLAKATKHVEVATVGETARQRLDARVKVS
jgi:hypothetical protein